MKTDHLAQTQHSDWLADLLEVYRLMCRVFWSASLILEQVVRSLQAPLSPTALPPHILSIGVFFSLFHWEVRFLHPRTGKDKVRQRKAFRAYDFQRLSFFALKRSQWSPLPEGQSVFPAMQAVSIHFLESSQWAASFFIGVYFRWERYWVSDGGEGEWHQKEIGHGLQRSCCAKSKLKRLGPCRLKILIHKNSLDWNW